MNDNSARDAQRKQRNSRELAFDALMKTLVQSPPKSLSDSLSYAKQHTDDPAFLQSLAYGVCRYWNQLSATVKLSLTKQLKAKDQDILLIIAMGVYQIKFMRVPDHAAINETVNLADYSKKSWAKGLINGVLRNFQRDAILASSKPALSYAHPKWLITLLKNDWPEHWQAILDANNQQPPFCLRINQQKTTRKAYQELLTAQEVDSDVCAYSPVGLRLPKPVDVFMLPEFESGWVSVQDEAAQLAAQLFDYAFNQSDCRILDACAAPGGKTLHLYERFPEAKITAVDVEEKRLTRLQESMDRLGAEIEVVCADVLSDAFDAQSAEMYDAILLDAPCSGTGVIRRHPDIKWLRQRDDIDVLVEQQLAMLHKLWGKLKSNGQLLYCTCSILKEENQQIIETFLQARNEIGDVSVEPLPVSDWGVTKNQASVGWQWLPEDSAPDGFYLCLLTKGV